MLERSSIARFAVVAVGVVAQEIDSRRCSTLLSVERAILSCGWLLVLTPTLCTCATGWAADPERDPAGWNALKFGMTRSQVLATLNGDTAGVGDSTRNEPLFGLSSVLDIPALNAACDEILTDSKSDADKYDANLVDTCRELKRLLAQRTWRLFDPHNRVTRSISARLQELQPSGNASDGTRVVLAMKKGTVVVAEKEVDVASRKLLTKAHEMARTLSEYYSRTNTQPRNAPPPSNASLAIPPRNIEIADIPMRAEFTMTPEGLAKVQFDHSFEGEGGGGTMHASFSTICRLLADKYGPPDDHTNSSSREVRTWRFPKTHISAVHVRVTVPNSSFVREGIVITYELPSAAKTVSEKDKL